MAKKIRDYTEEDEKGSHKVIDYTNNIKVKILKNPSPSYAAHLAQLARKNG